MQERDWLDQGDEQASRWISSSTSNLLTIITWKFPFPSPLEKYSENPFFGEEFHDWMENLPSGFGG